MIGYILTKLHIPEHIFKSGTIEMVKCLIIYYLFTYQGNILNYDNKTHAGAIGEKHRLYGF